MLPESKLKISVEVYGTGTFILAIFAVIIYFVEEYCLLHLI